MTSILMKNTTETCGKTKQARSTKHRGIADIKNLGYWMVRGLRMTSTLMKNTTETCGKTNTESCATKQNFPELPSAPGPVVGAVGRATFGLGSNAVALKKIRPQIFA